MTGAAGWPGPREPTWREVLEWQATTDAILRGLGHALNNRALAIAATIDALDPAHPIDAETAGALSAETQRLTSQLQALRGVAVHASDDPLPVLLKDVAQVAVELHRFHAAVGDVPATLRGSDEAPPVLVVEPLFVHALLVTLTALKTFAGSGGAVELVYGGQPHEATLTFVGTRDPLAAPDDGVPLSMLGTDLPGALLGAAGLEVEQVLGRDRCQVLWVLPSLREARRRAREAAAAAEAPPA